MALIYPRPWPGLIASAEFKLDDGVTLAPEMSGRVIAGQMAWPLWTAKFETKVLYGDQVGDFEAFIGSLRGGLKTFLARHPDRPYPRAYNSGFAGVNRAAGGAFDGTASTWSLDVTRALISATGLPANMALRRGDMFEWSWSGGNKRYLARLLEAATANGSGVLSATAFQPTAPTWLPNDAVLSFALPSCVMRLAPGSDSLPLGAGGRGAASFQAIQSLEP